MTAIEWFSPPPFPLRTFSTPTQRMAHSCVFLSLLACVRAHIFFKSSCTTNPQARIFFCTHINPAFHVRISCARLYIVCVGCVWVCVCVKM
mmetsp:Transcript_40965/g.103208  ORF Transcript_40965/g.103208 Transcript_40965/m.103208 type:complete len:91 (+) Transcript_40965:1373-1645(+)